MNKTIICGVCVWAVSAFSSGANMVASQPSSASQTITVTSPNGGETWTAGEPATVTWTSTGFPGDLPVTLFIRRGLEGPGAFGSMNVLVDDGHATFDVPTWLGDGGNYIVELWVSRYGYCISSRDWSDAPFTITGSTDVSGLELSVPDATTHWTASTQQDIEWTATNMNVDVGVFLFDGPEFLGGLGVSPASSGELAWDIPDNVGNKTSYRILLQGELPLSQFMPADMSPAFEVSGSASRPTLNITTPNGGEFWTAGTEETVCWTSSEASGYVWLALAKSGVTTVFLDYVPVEDGCVNVTVCPYIGDSDYYRVMGTLYADNGLMISDISDGDFSISSSAPEPTLELTSPDGGEVWTAGNTYCVTWDATNVAGQYVDIRLYRETELYMEYVDHLAHVPGEDGVWEWTICSYIGDASDYIVEISLYEEGCLWIGDASDAPFGITGSEPAPTLELTSPDGGEVWTAGDTYPIEWVSSNAFGKHVDISLFRDMGYYLEHVTGLDYVPAEDGAWEWTICPYQDDATDYVIQICIAEPGCPGVCDQSGAFEITGSSALPTLELISPNGGESWAVGSEQTISWDSNATDGTVHIEFRRDESFVGHIEDAPVTDDQFIWTVWPPHLEPGTDYTVRLEYYLESCPELNVSDESEATFEITTSRISGLVANTQGQLLESIVVELRGLPDEGGEHTAAYAVTNTNGIYTLIGVAPGHYRLRAGGTLEWWGMDQTIQDPGTGHWYQQVDWASDYDTAQALCKSYGGDIVKVSSQQENDWIWDNLDVHGCRSGGTDRDVEGEWAWVDGEPFTYTNWDEGEPNDGDGEDYLEWVDDGLWNDIDFSGGCFVCEYDTWPAPLHNYARLYYPNTPYSHEGEVIEVLESQHLTNRDFVLSPGSCIEGAIYESDGETPMEEASIHVCPSQWGSDASFHTQSAADGSYHIKNIYLGSFEMSVSADGYIPKHYNNKFPWEEQDNLIIPTPQTLSGVDYTMELAGSISGTVRIDGVCVEEAELSACGKEFHVCENAGTDTNGCYTIFGLSGDDYTVMLWPYTAPDGTLYGPEVYDDKLTWDSADLVNLPTNGASTSGIDFSLDRAGTIQGTIFDEITTVGLSGSRVCFELWDDSESHDTPFSYETNYLGEYTAILKPETYLVHAHRTGYVGEYYDGAHDPNWATRIEVVAGEAVPGINIYLNQNHSIEGTVLDGETTTPLPGVGLFAFPIPAVQGLGSGDVTNSNGEFAIEGLPDGDYEVCAAAAGYCQETCVPVPIDGDNVTNVLVLLNPAPPGDLDADCDLDLDDYAIFADCMAGPGVFDPPPGCDLGNFISADLDDDSDVDCDDWLIFRVAWTGPPAEPPVLPECDYAGLVDSAPANEESLWRTANNFIRLTFDFEITAPTDGELLIEVMNSNGAFGQRYTTGTNGTADFKVEVVPDPEQGGAPRILDIWENGSVLPHTDWIAVHNIGGWDGVAEFHRHYPVMKGDVNGDGDVLPTDFGPMFPKIPTFDSDPEERADVDGDRDVLPTDFGPMFPQIPTFGLNHPKPSGH